MSLSGPVVVVGLGGLGAPIAMALAASGLRAVRLIDGDIVERSNLHRQVLFREDDLGTPKVVAGAAAMRSLGYGGVLETVDRFFVPEEAMALAEGASALVEGVDNLPTKFLVADIASKLRVPVVHAAALRWEGTVLARVVGGACYRCVFEDLPLDVDAPNCAGEGVAGPLVGAVGAWAADRLLAILAGALNGSELTRFDGFRGTVRRGALAPRSDCNLCHGEPSSFQIERARYVSANAACASGLAKPLR
jgi:molybdopterin/thiamine biosynthesis adenylyltransferase